MRPRCSACARSIHSWTSWRAWTRWPTRSETSLLELARLFLKLGTIGFGGPAAHVALMEEEVVRRRRWLTHEEFLDFVGATNLIPGPNSTELAIHIGRARAGWPGLVVAGVCFILPATIIVTAIAWSYVRFGALPAVSGALAGAKPVVIVIVLQALLSLGRTAMTSRWLACIGGASAVAVALGVDELLVLATAAVVAMWPVVMKRDARAALAALPSALVRADSTSVAGAAAAAAAGAAGGAATAGLWPLFFVFAKIGSLLFGSGYVLLAFLRSDLVERLHWITERQLLDAVIVGQITPGPLFTTATFVGYLVHGVPGAAAATLGIFLPAFFFVALTAPLLPRLRRSALAGAALDGVNVASLALMAVVSSQLARTAIVSVPTALIAIVSAVLLLRFRVSSAALVAAGAMVGLVMM